MTSMFQANGGRGGIANQRQVDDVEARGAPRLPVSTYRELERARS